jgi:hypothetical protein
MQATPNHFRHHPPSPTAHASSQRGASQLGHGIPGTNLYGDFADVIEEEQPPQHRTRSQTARHSAHMVKSIRMVNSVIHPTTGAKMDYRGLISDEETFPIWDRAAANECGRLVQGVDGRIEGSITIYVIPRSAVPQLKTVTYGRFVVDVQPNKEEVHRVRLTVGGNLIKYDSDVSTRSPDLTTSKYLWNSVISTVGAKYMCLDVKKIYLGTPMIFFEYLRIPIKLIPLEIITHYSLLPFVSNGHIYSEVQKDMYGFPQAGILANLLLAKRLAPHGYRQTKTTPGLWAHDTLPGTLSLVVDHFGVKYEVLANAHHLINALEQHYTVSKYWTGGMYCVSC